MERFQPEQKTKLERPSFLSEKQAVLQWLNSEKQIDSRGLEEAMDENIVPLTRKLNERLDFLYTTASCGGHFRTADDIRAQNPDTDPKYMTLPRPGIVIGGGGYIAFVVDGGARSNEFLKKLQDLVKPFQGAKLKKHPRIDDQTAQAIRKTSPDFKLVPTNADTYTLQLIEPHDDDGEDDIWTVESVVPLKQQIHTLVEKLSDLVETF